MILILPILIFCLLVLFIYKLRFFHLEELPQWTAPAVFFVKVLFGLALWAVYTFYYTDRTNADIYKFYDDAHYVHQSFYENKSAFIALMTDSKDSALIRPYTSQMKNWERNFNEAVPFNENQFMIRLNALIMFISGENIHVHTILFCFLSFLGCMLLLKFFQHFLLVGKRKWVVITILFPSFLFWTSGGLKESIIVLALGLLLYGFIFLHKRLWISLLLLIGGLALLLETKYFLLLCLTPSLIAYYLFITRSSGKQVILKYAIILAVSVGILELSAPLNSKLNFAQIISTKQEYAVKEAQYMKAGSYSPVPKVEPTIASVIIHIPTGIGNSLMKPYLWQSRNPMMLLSAAENILVLILLILALVYRDKRIYHYNLLLFLLVPIVIYFGLIGLMAPVLGTLVRYKVVLMPLLIFLLLYILDTDRLTTVSTKR